MRTTIVENSDSFHVENIDEMNTDQYELKSRNAPMQFLQNRFYNKKE